MKTTLLTALLAVAASFPAGAHDVSYSDVADLPVSQVATFNSMPGEGMSAFVKRIAPDMVAMTAASGHEVCGMIAVRESDGVSRGAFSLKVGTIGSQISCSNDAVEDGYTNIRTSVHTHPLKRVIRLTALDMKARGTPAGKLRTETVDNCHFSGPDYSTSGYLLTCGKVLHQTGRGTEREVL